MISRLLRPGLFVGCLLSFFLNFATVRCTQKPIASITGLTLVTGGHAQPVQERYRDSTDDGSISENGNLKMIHSRQVPPQPWAVAAFVAATVGLMLSLFGFRGSLRLATVAGLVAVACLVVLRISVNDLPTLDLRSGGELLNMPREDRQFLNLFDVHWQPGYYLAAGLALLAAVTSAFGGVRTRVKKGWG